MADKYYHSLKRIRTSNNRGLSNSVYCDRIVLINMRHSFNKLSIKLLIYMNLIRRGLNFLYKGSLFQLPWSLSSKSTTYGSFLLVFVYVTTNFYFCSNNQRCNLNKIYVFIQTKKTITLGSRLFCAASPWIKNISKTLIISILQEHKCVTETWWLWVRSPLERLNYYFLIFSFLCSGTKVKAWR